MSDSAERIRAGELIQAHLDGGLGRAEEEELRSWLRGDAARMGEFVLQVHVHATLCERAMGVDAGAWTAAPGGSQPEGRMRRRHAVLWGWGLAAAVVLSAAGVWWGLTNAERFAPDATQAKELVARVTEVAGGVMGRSRETEKGGWELKAGDAVRTGTRIETREGGRVKLAYLGEKTEVDVMGSSVLRLRPPESRGYGGQVGVLSSESGGKQVTLEKGKLAATVAKQPKGAPFVVMTPHARIEVKGTRFTLAVAGTGNAARFAGEATQAKEQGTRNDRLEVSSDSSALRVPSSALGSTRLDVFDGLVGITKLSDGKSVDVAAGQYAVSEEGVELVALPMPRGGVPAGREEIERSPRRLTHLYGKVLFEDDFDKGFGNWEAVAFDPPARVEILGEEPGKHIILTDDFRRKKEMLKSCALTDPQDIRDRLVGIRTRNHIEAKRFVIEVRYFLKEPQNMKDGLVYTGGIEPGGRLIHVPHEISAGVHPDSSNGWYYWEFLPSGDSEDKPLLCRRCFSGERLVGLSYVRPLGKRILLGAKNQSVAVDKVIVRELLEEGGDRAGTR